MTPIILAIIGVALIVYTLQRNHIRNFAGARPAGSTNFEDRDTARIEADLAAITVTGRRRLF